MILQSLLAKKGILGSIATLLYGSGGGGITGGALGFNDSKLALSSIRIDEDPEEVSSVNTALPKTATVQQQDISVNAQSVTSSAPEPNAVVNQVSAQPTDNQSPAQVPSLQDQVVPPVTTQIQTSPSQDPVQSKPADTTVLQDTSDPKTTVVDDNLQTSALPQTDPLAQSTPSVVVPQPPIPATQTVPQAQISDQTSNIPNAPVNDVSSPTQPAPVVQSSEPSTEPILPPVKAKVTMPGKIAKDPFYKDIKEATDIEAKSTKVYCSNRMYAGKINGTNRPTENDISKTLEMHSGNQAGCITVLGYKENYADNKGKGGWKFIGTMRNGTYSAMFISTLVAEEGKLMIDGNTYILSSTQISKQIADTNGLDGKLVQLYINNGRQEVTNESKERLILQPGAMMENATRDGGFNFDNTNVCKPGECTGDVLSYEASTESWTFKINGRLNGQLYHMKDGSENKSKGTADNGLFPKHLTDPYDHLVGYFKKMDYSEIPKAFQFND